jgi:hypothetical protein
MMKKIFIATLFLATSLSMVAMDEQIAKRREERQKREQARLLAELAQATKEILAQEQAAPRSRYASPEKTEEEKAFEAEESAKGLQRPDEAYSPEKIQKLHRTSLFGNYPWVAGE